MANSVYQINKGINKPIEFKGLKAQYIWYLGGCILILLIVFAVLYIMGFPPLACTGIVLLAGVLSMMEIYSMSNKYGAHGLMKKMARSRIPRIIKARSRNTFKKQFYEKTTR